MSAGAPKLLLMASRRRTEPVFHNVVDLGLRDVGIRNDPRRLAVRSSRMLIVLVMLAVATAAVTCVVAVQAGADGPVVGISFAGCIGAATLLLVRMLSRLPPTVVRVHADGGNQAVWMLVVPMIGASIALTVLAGPTAIPVVARSLAFGLLLGRRRDHVPAALRELRGLVGPGERVLGDGLGLARGRRGPEAFRIVAVTDRRLLVTGSLRAPGPFALVDVPLPCVARFGIGWSYRGRAGVLSVVVAGADGAPEARHEIASIAPANLVSVATALRAGGVRPDDPAKVDAAVAAWAAARRRGEAAPVDRAAMHTRAFDLGLWLLVAVAVCALYVNPFGVGIGAAHGVVAALPVIFLAGCAGGYLAGTRLAIAYLAPLNLLVIPAFLFFSVPLVIVFMQALSALAAAGLLLGAMLRERRRAPADRGPAQRQPGRSGLRQALSGAGLVRLSRGLLVAGAVSMTTASAFGFEPIQVRLAVDEATVAQRPADGRSNLTGGAASLTYTPADGLREFVTDEEWSSDPADGARWEVRSSFLQGQNFVSLASYVFEPRLDDPDAVADFVTGKDDEHAAIAGHVVEHTRRVVDGRSGYVWEHGNDLGYWHYAMWFPAPTYSVRLECIARKQTERFKDLCEEAASSLRFR